MSNLELVLKAMSMELLGLDRSILESSSESALQVLVRLNNLFYFWKDQKITWDELQKYVVEMDMKGELPGLRENGTLIKEEDEPWTGSDDQVKHIIDKEGVR